MEAEAACDAACDAESVLRRMKSGPDSSTFPEPGPDDVDTVSKIAATPASEKTFPFLNLPPEIRNMVYQCSSIYETAKSWRFYGVLTFPDLRQAAITRVNKQLRNETLPIFYGMHEFFIELSIIHKHDDPAVHQDAVLYVWGVLRAFTPDRNSTLQPNSLSFLSHLTFRTEIHPMVADYFDALGFTMSSGHIECDDETDHSMDTAGLDWDNFLEVREAYLVAIKSCITARNARKLLGVFVPYCGGVADAAGDLADLMWCISSHCPQLKSNVLAFLEPDDDLYEQLEEMGRAE